MFLPIAVVQLLAASGMLGFVWVEGQQALERERDALVDELHDDLVSDYRAGGIKQLREEIDLRLVSEGARAPILLLVDGQDRRLAGNIREWPTARPGAQGRMTTALTRIGAAAPEDMRLRTEVLGHGYRLAMGWTTGDDRRLTRSYRQALAIALLLSFPLSLLVASLISRSISRRIHGLAETARHIGSGTLHARMPLDGSGDSFDELAIQINAMLGRIEGLVEELQLVTDGLAHDLRSPVTRLKSVIERATAETDDPRALAALDHAASEADMLIAMLGTALQITRAEAGIGRDRFTPTDLGPFLADLADLYAPLAEDHGFTLAVEADERMAIPLNRELVSQALGNLIDNALKYAAGGSRIVLAARARPEGVGLSVCDNGPGIPEDQRPSALRRFGRLDPARSIAGSGLGLSLAEAVARLHGGTLILSDHDPGLCVTLALPGGEA